ncbi:MAG: pyridoxal-phosphate dependent enzyme [Actinobacteria bacterium]|nr:pyridoxal-phosphate dependent enzyme [Actinomycetota bacterium]
MAEALCLPSPLQEITDPGLGEVPFRFFLKRDDLISPDLPGNKWRKLKYNLEAARAAGQRTLLTFGGAYSNHVRATAAAGARFGFATVGVIRGEEHRPLNPSLRDAADRGMRLVYLDRASYRAKTSAAVIAPLREEFGDFYLLPEGGSNALAARGCAELTAEITVPFDVLCVPCGTGGTLAGVAAGLTEGQRAVGFSALRGGAGFLPAAVRALQDEAFGGPRGDWRVDDEFHFGGFARRTPELDAFIAGFRARHGLTLDWVYVAKMLYGVYAHGRRGTFAPGTTVIAVVTG